MDRRGCSSHKAFEGCDPYESVIEWSGRGERAARVLRRRCRSEGVERSPYDAHAAHDTEHCRQKNHFTLNHCQERFHHECKLPAEENGDYIMAHELKHSFVSRPKPNRLSPTRLITSPNGRHEDYRLPKVEELLEKVDQEMMEVTMAKQPLKSILNNPIANSKSLPHGILKKPKPKTYQDPKFNVEGRRRQRASSESDNLITTSHLGAPIPDYNSRLAYLSPNTKRAKDNTGTGYSYGLALASLSPVQTKSPTLTRNQRCSCKDQVPLKGRHENNEVHILRTTAINCETVKEEAKPKLAAPPPPPARPPTPPPPAPLPSPASCKSPKKKKCRPKKKNAEGGDDSPCRTPSPPTRDALSLDASWQMETDALLAEVHKLEAANIPVPIPKEDSETKLPPKLTNGTTVKPKKDTVKEGGYHIEDLKAYLADIHKVKTPVAVHKEDIRMKLPPELTDGTTVKPKNDTVKEGGCHIEDLKAFQADIHRVKAPFVAVHKEDIRMKLPPELTDGTTVKPKNDTVKEGGCHIEDLKAFQADIHRVKAPFVAVHKEGIRMKLPPELTDDGTTVKPKNDTVKDGRCYREELKGLLTELSKLETPTVPAQKEDGGMKLPPKLHSGTTVEPKTDIVKEKLPTKPSRETNLFLTSLHTTNPFKVLPTRKDSPLTLPDCVTSCLRPSLFPRVPPYLRFVSHDEAAPLKIPVGIAKHLKWKLTTITPIVVKKTLMNSGFRLVKSDCDTSECPQEETVEWIGIWGKHMKSLMFRAIKDGQKMNHFPGTFQIGRKDRLWRNLQKLAGKFGEEEFGIMPRTYVLPHDMRLLKHDWERHSANNEKWIIKPPASARGTGIKVVSRWTQIPKKRPVVVQRYVNKPYLINGSKFDMRLYVLVTSVHPLRIYLYKDGLARFASVKYTDEVSSLNDRYMHLTNYSINRLSKNYTPNEDFAACEGHKWTLLSLFQYLKTVKRVDTDALWEAMKDLVIKTIISGEGSISSLTKANVTSRYNCYELFGIDVLLDEDLKPWLLEVNISPSLHSASPLDIHVKGPLVSTVLNVAQFQVPIKTNLESLTKEKPNKLAGLPYDCRLYTIYLSKEERDKHIIYTNMEDRDMYLRDVLSTLTPDDVRHLIQAEDELSACGPDMQCIFPRAHTHRYLPYLTGPRYYNRLFDAWETRYASHRETGLELLRTLCDIGYHLEVPPVPLKNDVDAPSPPASERASLLSLEPAAAQAEGDAGPAPPAAPDAPA